MNKLLYVLICFSFLSACKESARQTDSDIVLHFEVQGLEYQNLYLNAVLLTQESVNIAGKKEDAYHWSFHIPDSIYKRSYTMRLYERDSLIRHLSFSFDTSKYQTSYFFLDDRISDLEIVYRNTDTLTESSWGSRQVNIGDNFDVPDTNSRAGLFFKLMRVNLESGSLPEDSRKAVYLDLIRKYSDSRTCISYFYMYWLHYLSRANARTLFSNFTAENRESYFGQKIQRYLSQESIFPNIQLPASYKSKPEYVIQDSSRYNLVIFSASWCRGCHLMAPLLKEIYKDLQSGLNLTYITIDKPETLANWTQWMEKNEIPWRSLVAADYMDEICDQYDVLAIPVIYLVYPDGKYENISVNKQADRDRLYEVVRNKEVKF